MNDDLRREISRLHHRLDESIRSSRWRRDDQERAEKAGDYRGQYRQASYRLASRLANIGSSSRPVLLGPWTGEVGFELLYWIPFLTWAVKRRRLAPQRLIAVSRGGPRLWYEHLTSSYRDVLEFVSPESYREQASIQLKQTSWSPLDAATLGAVRGSQRMRMDLLHPQLMYRLFVPVWRQGGSIADVRAFTRFPRFTRPAPQEWQQQLPADYVAVKFYASGQFRDSDESRRFATQTIRRLTERTDVVLLTSGTRLDDHAELANDSSPRVHRIDHLVTPETNLDVQSRIIAHARAFVGSYGGFSYLAPFFGVPSLSFYASRGAFFEHHLELARHVFDPEQGPGLVALHLRDAALIDSVLAR